MRKIMLVFGTRPEAIKMCPLVIELKSRPELEIIVCVSGQHREMLDQVLDVFEITPDYNLNIMRDNQSLFDITNNILLEIEDVLAKENPDLVLVHGDTSTTFVTALAAFYKQIPIGHVEAGLRTHNIYSPYPEEFNRQAVGILAKYHFSPTEMAKDNLIREGKAKESIYVTGNTAIDALKTTVQASFQHEILDWANGSRLVLLTAHRRENLGKPMENIFSAVRRVVDEFPDIKLVYPVHKNPKVLALSNKYLSQHPRIRLIDPLEVIEFHNIQANAYLILTDSGGIQEEAPSLGKPVLVLRDTTERPEGVSAGTLRLIGTKEDDVYKSFVELLTDSQVYKQMSQASNPYGDGFASRRIADIIVSD